MVISKFPDEFSIEFSEISLEFDRKLSKFKVSLLGDLPDWIQIGRHRSRAPLGLADVNRDVRVRRSGLVFGDQALSTDDCGERRKMSAKVEKCQLEVN